MDNHFDLTRFLDAQNKLYPTALAEIRSGKKQSHWMWFIFPQLKGLGQSDTAKFYGIDGIEEASAYLAHPVLRKHLIGIATALLEIDNRSASDIFSSPDDLKLCSSMTLFASAPNTDTVFTKVIDKYFNGLHDERTLQILIKHQLQ